MLGSVALAEVASPITAPFHHRTRTLCAGPGAGDDLTSKQVLWGGASAIR
jgi:hypothetical protein